MESVFWEWFQYLVVLLLLIIFAYAVVRVGSFAYFRTKLEYLRKMLSAMKGEEDGKG